MAEYNLGLSQKIVETAEIVTMDGLTDFDAVQTVMYLSLLASEIALKALLEQAGQPAGKIRARSHNLKALLEDLGRCQIRVEVTPSQVRLLPASGIRAITVDPNYGNATVGTLLEAADAGASRYPNQVRYGDSFRHYPPQVIVKMASEIVKWAKQHWDDIRLP